MSQSAQSPYSAAGDSAPEVWHSSAPMYIAPDEEGLQKVEPQASVMLVKDNVSSQQEFDPREKHTAIAESRHPWRRWKYYLLALVLILICIAAGLGAGYAIGKAHRQNNQSSIPATPTTVTVTMPQGTSSAATSAVTSGATGLASYDCKDTVGSTYTTPSGTTYVEECHTDYYMATWNASATDSNATVHDLNVITVYTFEGCMDQCDAYNGALQGGQPCRAVTYNANLTLQIQMQGGNCFLKDTRGAGWNGHQAKGVGETDFSKYTFLASAYADCVPDGC